MANKFLTFMPEDFDTVVPYEVMVKDIADIINEIRSNKSKFGNVLYSKVKELKRIEKDVNLHQSSEKSYYFQLYKQIQSISMDLRKLLKEFFKNVEIYDSIGYVFYYNGTRYTVEEIKLDWLSMGSNKGRNSLLIDLDKAVSDIKENITTNLQNSISKMIENHLQNYSNAITGMYKRITGQETSSKINRGRISEAFESHLASHHSNSYNLLNKVTTSEYSSMEKILVTHDFSKEFNETYWAEHESPTAAWKHIRGAQGTQRGTVAGDVGRMQVKAGHKYQGYTTRVRLSSVNNLEQGIKLYSDIFNPDINPAELAKKLARYLTEPVKIASQTLMAKIANSQGWDLTIKDLEKPIKFKLVNI